MAVMSLPHRTATDKFIGARHEAVTDIPGRNIEPENTGVGHRIAVMHQLKGPTVLLRLRRMQQVNEQDAAGNKHRAEKNRLGRASWSNLHLV